MVLYLLVATAGLPIFAGGKAGVVPWFGPTAGYLVAFVVCTIAVGLVTGVLLRNGLGKLTWLWMICTVFAFRVLIMYPLATLGISIAAKKPFTDVMAVDLVYWPGDVLKTVFAVLIAIAVFKAFPRLMQR